ncbi:MAG: hypothetical protein JRI25_02305 [Deltaproteobacteria bacterium]|nr:hypothetical protein [Deltaproteobacteria bacterium]
MALRSLVLVSAIGVSTGCYRELPEHELGTQSRLLFRDFDLDQTALATTVDEMDSLLGELDLEAKPRDRAFNLPTLTEEYRTDVTVAPGIDVSEQFGVGIGAISSHGVDDNMDAQTQEDQVCINADAIICHRRDFLTDVDCFLDQTCDVLRTFNVIRNKTLITKFWIEVYVDFRWVELPDGRAAVASRTWMEDPFESDGGKSVWDQRFGVDLFIPDPDDDDRARRWYGMWLGGDVKGVGDNWTRKVLVDSLDEGFENPDAWLDGEECKIDTDECEFP